MQYISTVTWQLKQKPFTPKDYDRTHTVGFGGGFSIEASAAPEYLGDANLPNPEELFAGSIASCFMLTFLYLAAMKKLIIEEFRMKATGTLAKNSEGKMAITKVELEPDIRFFEDKTPEMAVLRELYKKAHENCFISSSVKTEVTVKETQTV